MQNVNIIDKPSKIGLRRCSRCRNVNPLHSKFCENCGARLVTPSSVFKLASKRYKELPKSFKALVSLIIVIAVLAILVGGAVGYIFSPARTAEIYFKAFADNDFGAMYDCYGDMPKSDFVNKQLYIDLFETESEETYNGNIINFQITDNDSRDSGSSSRKSTTDKIAKDYYIAYTITGTSRIQNTTITLIKQKEKKFFIFDSWAVVPEEIIADNYRIRTLKGATVILNETEIEDQYLLQDDEDSDDYYYYDDSSNYDTYIIPTILVGTYDISVKLPYSQTMEDSIYIQDGDSVSITDGFELDTNIDLELQQKAVDSVNEIYNAVIAGKDFSAVSHLFSTDEQDEARGEYDYLYERYKQTGRMLKAFSANRVASQSRYRAEINSDGRVSIYYSFDYSYTLNVQKGWYGDEYEDVSYQSNDTASIEFIKENGQWVMTHFVEKPALDY